MVTFLMKSGETKEIADEDMLSFLEENRDSIQIQHSERVRRPFSEQLEPYTDEMSTEDDKLLEEVDVA